MRTFNFSTCGPATLFADPSTDEGFGFGALEAVACRCPMISSRATALPEVCGNAARLVACDSKAIRRLESNRRDVWQSTHTRGHRVVLIELVAGSKIEPGKIRGFKISPERTPAGHTVRPCRRDAVVDGKGQAQGVRRKRSLVQIVSLARSSNRGLTGLGEWWEASNTVELINSPETGEQPFVLHGKSGSPKCCKPL